jgi:hypothetical protein
MTQTASDQITLYSVRGKDRLSDPWITFESRWRWEIAQWAEQRAFVVRDEDGEPVVEERNARPARIERRDAQEGWVAYSAPMSYAYQVRWLDQHDRMHPATVGFYRLVEVEETPAGADTE